MAGGADRKHAILPCRSRGFDGGTTAALESHVRSVPTDGPVAQLGARLNGIQEVTGSIPVRSTISKPLILNSGNATQIFSWNRSCGEGRQTQPYADQRSSAAERSFIHRRRI